MMKHLAPPGDPCGDTADFMILVVSRPLMARASYHHHETAPLVLADQRDW
jgi:hypothetical protein